MPITHAETEISNQPIGVTGPLTNTELRATPVPVSGTVTATPTGTQDVNVTATVGLTATELRATPVPVSVSGTVATTVGGSAVATVTSVAVSTTVATLSASNVAKTKVIVHNEGGILYIKLGSGATNADYSYRLTANSLLEITGYTGIVTAIKQTGSTNAQVTEVGI